MSTPLVSYEIPTDREDLSDVLSKLSEYSTPVLARILNGTMAATNTTHEWVNKKLRGFAATLEGDITSGATTITCSGESEFGIPVKYLVFNVLEIDDEQMQIVSNPVVNGADFDLTVTRGYAGTTAAAHDDQDDVDIIDRPLPEGFVPSESEHQFGAKAQNITQLFGGFVSLSSSSTGITVAGSDNNMATQISDILDKLRKELERTVIRGKTRVDGVGDNRRMDGLEGFLSGASESRNAAAEILSPKILEEELDEIHSVGGRVDMILTSQRQKNRFNDFMEDRVRDSNPQESEKFKKTMRVYEGEYGPIPIEMSLDVKTDTVFLLDMSRIQAVPLQGRAFSMKPQGQEGMNERMYIEGEYTMEFRNPESHRRIHNLDVS